MPRTAPARTMSYLIIKERHLAYKLAHRPAATYFQTPVDLQHALQKVRTNIMTLKHLQEEAVSC